MSESPRPAPTRMLIVIPEVSERVGQAPGSSRSDGLVSPNMIFRRVHNKKRSGGTKVTAATTKQQ